MTYHRTVGILGAALLTRALRGMLYGVTPLDPAAFVGAAVVLGCAGLLACAVPAARAARLDPAPLLREG